MLMDGNVGMGGDVDTLLARCAQLVRPGGLVICEVDRVAGRHENRTVVLRTDDATSVALPWSRVGAAALLEAANSLDLLLVEEWTAGERAFVALRSMNGRL